MTVAITSVKKNNIGNIDKHDDITTNTVLIMTIVVELL